MDEVERGFDSFWENKERGEVERTLSDVLSELADSSVTGTIASEQVGRRS